MLKVFLFWYIFLLICNVLFIWKVIDIIVFLLIEVIVNWLKYFIGFVEIIIYVVESLCIGIWVVILIDE